MFKFLGIGWMHGDYLMALIVGYTYATILVPNSLEVHSCTKPALYLVSG